MHRFESCRNGCTYSRQKNRIWHVIASHPEGICTDAIAERAGVSIKNTEVILEDLYVEEKILFKRRTGKWYPEMLPIH